MKKDNRQEINQRIENAEEPTERFGVCVEAQRVLSGLQGGEKLEYFIWFIETAEAKWFSDTMEDDGARDILEMLQVSDESRPEQELPSPVEEFSETQLRDYARKYSRLVNGFVDVFSIDGRTKEDFYQCILSTLDAFGPLRDDRLAWSYCMFELILDGRIPYYQIRRGLQMEQGAYYKSLADMKESIKKLDFIRNLRHCQKMERASQILYLLDELPTLEQKSILLGSLIVPPSESE